ncbi:MAG TPA: hypothetical protein DEB06_03770 [Phycisphaerales bacterium]|nr:hypothetical protein [Phycisphaerales bacterium]
MCTVTIIPLPGGGLRLMTNRDESRARPAAAPPALRESPAGVQGLWPLDPVGGGTWVASNEHGVVLALLNGNPRPMPAMPTPERLRSRGGLIPSLAYARRAADALAVLRAGELDEFAPFRLVAADGSGVLDAAWDRRRLQITRRILEPVCFVSSGLGDERVSQRLSLFSMWMEERGVSRASQTSFHDHRWPDKPEVSVMMSRADARTVSVTTVEVTRDGSSAMIYRDDAGQTEARLPRVEALAIRRA